MICLDLGSGRQHDFRIYKNSRIKVIESVQLMADKGYQGIAHYHANIYIPYKKSRFGQLSPEQRQHNKEQARLRVQIENVIRTLKIFRILSSRYRNRRKRFGLRFNLIAGLYNYEIQSAALS